MVYIHLIPRGLLIDTFKPTSPTGQALLLHTLATLRLDIVLNTLFKVPAGDPRPCGRPPFNAYVGLASVVLH